VPLPMDIPNALKPRGTRESHPCRYAPPGVAFLIPAYCPPPVLETLVRGLVGSGATAIVLVDDGSPNPYAGLFAGQSRHAVVHLLRHPQNLGKGSALKTGLRHIIDTLPDCPGVVTADADGQHALADILAVARALYRRPNVVILGARQRQSGVSIPLRSRFGNRVLRGLFRLATGVALADTQTGLRAFPAALLPVLSTLPGTRYDYEMAVLLHLARTGHPLAEQPVRSLYDPGNPGSHFRPLGDSLHVLRTLLPNGSAQHLLPETAPLDERDLAGVD
jgi:hypothetical protein